MNLPLNIDLQQILLHMFNFIILTGGMYFLLYQPVRNFMEKRRAYYAGLEEESKAKMTQANLLKEEYEGKMAEAEKEIAARRAEAQQELERSREAEIKKATRQAQEILEQAQSQGEKEKERIVAQAQGDIAQLAAEATKRLLYETSSQAFDSFLDSAEGSVKDE